jgi:hypothetical protein
MAEDLLETVGQVFGPVRGGLAIAVILVGALLAATTGVVAAAVISMGLISLPIMLRYGYNRTIATGTITASGTLAQAIPPSLVLIVLADQLGRSVGDMYAGALIPGLLLVGCYLLFVVAVAIFKPDGCRRCRPKPASTASPTAVRPPLAAGAAGHLPAVGGFRWAQVHDACQTAARARDPGARDEIFILSMTIGLAAGAGAWRWSTTMSCEAGPAVAPGRAGDLRADPAAGADLPGAGHHLPGRGHAHRGRRHGCRGRVDHGDVGAAAELQAAEPGAGQHGQTGVFVLFILIGSTVFSFTFNAADGHIWVEHLFDKTAGRALGFLIVVNILVFILGMFIDFFEIAFIVMPMLAPVAEKMLPELVPGLSRTW